MLLVVALFGVSFSPAHAEYAEGMEAYRRAWAAYETQRFEEAQDWAHRAVRADRENAHAHALLGDLCYLRHDLEGAKGEWAQALALAPHLTAIGGQMAQAEMELALESRMEPVQLGSLVVRVPRSVIPAKAGIKVKTDPRLRGDDHPILATLEQAVEGLEPYFGYRPQRPLTVLIYPRESFYAATHLPAQVLGLFDGKIRVPESSVVGARVLWHEYAHALVHDLSHGQAPRWLHEGLAQEAEGLGQDARPQGTVRAELVEARTELPPLRRLLGIADRPGEAVVMPAGQFYAGAHDLVRYLLGLKGWDRMRRLLGALGEGEPVEAALERLYGWDLRTLEQKWRARRGS